MMTEDLKSEIMGLFQSLDVGDALLRQTIQERLNPPDEIELDIALRELLNQRYLELRNDGNTYFLTTEGHARLELVR